MVRRKGNVERHRHSPDKRDSIPASESQPQPSTSKSANVTRSGSPFRNVDAGAGRSVSSNRKTITVVRGDCTTQDMTKAMYKSIMKLQLSTKLLIPRLSFARLVREIIMDIAPRTDWRIQSEALNALQESAELYLTQYFEDSYLCTTHAKRQTLFINDMQLARRIRGREDVINH